MGSACSTKSTSVDGNATGSNSHPSSHAFWIDFGGYASFGDDVGRRAPRPRRTERRSPTPPPMLPPATTMPHPTQPPATTEPPPTQPPATTEPPPTQPPATTEPPPTQPPATTEPPPTQPPATNTQLKILTVDLKLKSNMFMHHTHDIDEPDWLVVRRGQAFTLSLALDRPYNSDSDHLKFAFKTGNYPNVQKRTYVVVPLGSSSSAGEEWKAEVDTKDQDKLTVSVTTAPDAMVGKYSLTVHTEVSSNDNNEPAKFSKKSGPIYLLFNAWCENDSVYMEKREEQEEYVLNETGYIWYGSSRQLGSRPWAFDQFEKSVFEAVMYLLEAHVKDGDRCDPVLVSRIMSAAVNAQDDNGVLVGKWGGDYGYYTKPTKWAGSKRILEQYFRNKSPVRYGQCWVFSGVLTTVLRCLGIPARSVTNYASAHDTDVSLTIDKHFYESGEIAEKYNSDSVWNFHVWNEAWMSRPDLPAGYGGWQAVDATPQETSDGVYQTGPCPVNAIKQGQVYYGYDAKFVFAEVNGDIMHWEVKPNGEMELLSKKLSNVGKMISTKAVGSKDRLDITHEYKHPEGSDAERAVVKVASEHARRRSNYNKPETVEDVDMSIEFQDLYIGADFDIVVPVVNKSTENRNISVTIAVQVVYYTGVLAGRVKKFEPQKKKLEPGEKNKVTFHIDADDYLDKLVDQSAMKVILLGRVYETRQAVCDEEDLRLRTPDLDIKLMKPKANEIFVTTSVKAEISLKNPLKKTLTRCEISIEGRGLLSPRDIPCKNLGPGETLTQTVDFNPRLAGKRTLVATFESDQLSQVTGELEVHVQR